MIKQMEKEAEEDEEVYDKMACWCETNEKEKTKAIKDAEARIAQLETELEEEVAKSQAALDKATSIREKELANFNGEEKE